MTPALIFLLFALSTGTETDEQVRSIPPGKTAIEIVMPVATPEDNRSCVVELPEKRIASVVLSWREEDLSIEKTGGRLFLRLLHPVEGSLHVIGGSGILYRLHLRPAKEGETPDVHIRLAAPPAGPPRRIPSIELLRAMKTGIPFPGLRDRPAKRILLKTDDRRFLLLRRFDAPCHRGYVLRLENRTKTPFQVDPERFDAEGLLLIGADRWEVPALSETRLYLIFQK